MRSRTFVVCVLSLVCIRAVIDGSAPLERPALTVSLSIDSSSAHAGTQLTFTASVDGEAAPVEYAFWLYEGGVWQCVREYGPGSVLEWTPSAPGLIAVQVWVRHVGSSVHYEAWTGSGYIQVGAPREDPARLIGISADGVLPATSGIPVTWSARASGTWPEFQFWRYDPSGWRLVQEYGPENSYTWLPGRNDAGPHALQVWVRRRGSAAPYEDWGGTGFFEVIPAGPVTSVSLTTDRPLPPAALESVTWTAASGARQDVEYQFWRYSQSKWTMVQDYGVGASYTWTPGMLDLGANALQVWARAAGSTAPFEAWTGSGIFAVTEPACQPRATDASICHQPVPSYVGRDYLADLQVRTAADIVAKRRDLIQFIWGHDTLPAFAAPPADAVETGVAHPAIAALNLPNLRRVDRYRIESELPAARGEPSAPLRSYVYEFVPAAGNDRLVVYHQGHIRDASLVFEPATMLGADHVLRVFLELGYTVLFVQMPLLGDNADPRFPVDGEANPHDLLGATARPGFNPLKVFLDPIRTAIGYARSRRTYTSVGMIGVSGGGWAVTAYAALDPEISASFPVAGSLPVTLNRGADDPCSHGLDWEQAQFPVVPADGNSGQPLGYLDLYVLGSTPAPDDAPRQQIQILNRYDSCCFTGAKAEGTYGDQISEHAARLGGTYRLAIDGTHAGHLISACALRAVVLPALGHGGS